MFESSLRFHYILLLFFCAYSTALFAENVLIYDPEKGIIFAEKKTTGKRPQKAASKPIAQKNTSSTDLHVGRKKDSSDLYFRSGLEYFQNSDFKNAFKNFSFADSIDPHPEYKLWKAKTFRQLGHFDEMLFHMQQIIENFPESDVADDALFELALHYQKIDDYHRAYLLYTRLAEQYPFGILFSTKEEFREIAREQKKIMRAELINLLSILGFSDDDLNINLNKFQKSNLLEVTGYANQKTVQLLKQKHNQFLLNEEMKAKEELIKNQHKFKLLIAGAISLFTILIQLFLRSRIRLKSQQLSEMNKILTELDLSRL